MSDAVNGASVPTAQLVIPDPATLKREIEKTTQNLKYLKRMLRISEEHALVMAGQPIPKKEPRPEVKPAVPEPKKK